MKDEYVEIAVRIPHAKIDAALKKGVQHSQWDLERIARDIFYAAVKKRMREKIGNVDELIDANLEKMDWGKIVRDVIEERARRDD